MNILVSAGDELVLRVTDNGVGMVAGRGEESEREGLGLPNLHERAGLLGGSLDISPGADGGTHLVWRVPLAGAPRGSSAQVRESSAEARGDPTS